MDRIRGLLRLCALAFVLFVGLASISLPGALGWSKEGHMMTCRIAQVNISLPVFYGVRPMVLSVKYMLTENSIENQGR